MTSADTSSADAAEADKKAKHQRDNLSRRITANAKAIISGEWADLKSSYSPREPVVKGDAHWQELVAKQSSLKQRIAQAKAGDRKDKYDLTMAFRKEFPQIAKKWPVPNAPALPFEPLPPSAAPASLEQQHKDASFVPPSNSRALSDASTGEKRKQPMPDTSDSIKQEPITVDDDDDDEEPTTERESSLYVPDDEARPTKRQRSKAVVDDEDLQYQLEEVPLSAELKIIQIKRKNAYEYDDLELQLQEIPLHSKLKMIQIKRKMAMLDKKAKQAEQNEQATQTGA